MSGERTRPSEVSRRPLPSRSPGCSSSSPVCPSAAAGCCSTTAGPRSPRTSPPSPQPPPCSTARTPCGEAARFARLNRATLAGCSVRGEVVVVEVEVTARVLLGHQVVLRADARAGPDLS